MGDVENTIDRDGKGRFQTGHKAAGPGRPLGSRARLGSAFISDLHDVWEEYGAQALRRCAIEEPAQFCRVVASLLPKQLDVEVSHGIDPQAILGTFRAAVAALQSDQPPPPAKVIDAKRI